MRSDPHRPRSPMRGSLGRRPECAFCRLRASTGYRTVDDSMYRVDHQVPEGGPALLGALLFYTRRQVPNLGELSGPKARRLGSLVARVGRALLRVTDSAWTYCFGFTEGFRHVHLVILPRFRGPPARYVRLAVPEWPDAPRGGRDEVARLCRGPRAELRFRRPTAER